MEFIKLQIWATWLMYAVLVDLSDAVAGSRSVVLRTNLDGNGVTRFVSFHYAL
jgi:hypothetical protein